MSHGVDSVLTDQVRKLALFITSDPFWMADIEQIEITPRKTFRTRSDDWKPSGTIWRCKDYQLKFTNLFIFYRDVLCKTGFDKYSIVNVEYAGQVIATKKESNISKSDSLQAVKNILQMIRSAQQLQADTVRKEVKPLEHNTETEQTLVNYDMVAEKDDDSATKPVIKKNGNKK
jgi:cell division protein FtsQ